MGADHALRRELSRRVREDLTAAVLGRLRADSGQVEYHLGNIYAKSGLKGRQQLCRLLSDSGLGQQQNGQWR